MPVHVCIPVLKRYDLLRMLFLSLRFSTLPPSMIYVIDNGRDQARMNMAMSAAPVTVYVHRPEEPMGVAESWNWFIQNVSEDRIISNDDVTFAPDSLATIVAVNADLVWASGFSCFLIRDSCVEKIGLFDETISPGYGYYEDDDYLQRIDGRGTKPAIITRENVVCGVIHKNSQTLAASTPAEREEHHRKFLIAQRNYAAKWHLEKEFNLVEDVVK